MINIKELESILIEKGADFVGYADLKDIAEGELKNGISFAIKLPKDIIASIENGPNRDYLNAYHELNEKLNQIAIAGAEYLEKCGYKALAQTTTMASYGEELRTSMPHKTVAVNAGLGWIGKCALFITEKYGAGIRLSSILTNAPLPFGNSIEKSKCGSCTACQDNCPAKAVSGKIWKMGMDREEFFDAHACHRTARKLSKDLLNEDITICGICINSCPYTKKYINS